MTPAIEDTTPEDTTPACPPPTQASLASILLPTHALPLNRSRRVLHYNQPTFNSDCGAGIDDAKSPVRWTSFMDPLMLC